MAALAHRCRRGLGRIDRSDTAPSAAHQFGHPGWGKPEVVQRTLGHAWAVLTLDVYAGLLGDDLDALADIWESPRQVCGLPSDYIGTTGGNFLPPGGRTPCDLGSTSAAGGARTLDRGIMSLIGMSLRQP